MKNKFFEIKMVIETNNIENDEQISNLLEYLKIKEKRISRSAVTACKEVEEYPNENYYYK